LAVLVVFALWRFGILRPAGAPDKPAPRPDEKTDTFGATQTATSRVTVSTSAQRTGAATTKSAAATHAPSTGSAVSQAGGSDARGDDGSALAAGRGYLIVESSADAEVRVNGKNIGKTNQKLESYCGYRNIRLRSAKGVWLSPGQPLQIGCRTVTKFRIEPATAKTP